MIPLPCEPRERRADRVLDPLPMPWPEKLRAKAAPATPCLNL